MKSTAWKAVGTLASIGAAVAARNAATSLWKKRVGSDPPVNPADPETDWREAIAWTLATGMLVGLARLFARRGAAALWEKMDGSLPPELHEAK